MNRGARTCDSNRGFTLPDLLARVRRPCDDASALLTEDEEPLDAGVGADSVGELLAAAPKAVGPGRGLGGDLDFGVCQGVVHRTLLVAVEVTGMTIIIWPGDC